MRALVKTMLFGLSVGLLHAGTTEAAPVAAELPTADLSAAERNELLLRKMFTVSAFGTLGLVHSNNRNADYTATLSEKNGAGYTDQWSPNVNSRLGAQVSAQFTPALSGVIQLVSEQNADGTYAPSIEWLNLRYDFVPGFGIRVGRTAMSTSLASDYRKVGYTLPWARTPGEVYDFLTPISRLDGIDIIWQKMTNGVYNTFRTGLGIGHNHVATYQGAADGDHTWYISDQIEYNAWIVHANYVRTKNTLSTLEPLMHAFQQFGPQGVAISDKYGVNNKLLSVSMIGISYDPGKWFITAEFAASRTHSLFASRNGWYVGGGYRIGAFTPYALYARMRLTESGDTPQISLTGLPPAAAAAASGLNAAARQLETGKIIQNTIAAGVRWDFAKHFDLKLQYDRTSAGGASNGVYTNLQPGFRPGMRTDLITAVIDFVF